jgi:hypothetical protein
MKMSLLREDLSVADQSQNVDKNPIVGLLVELSFLGAMILI